jgi:hypothetical protein
MEVSVSEKMNWLLRGLHPPRISEMFRQSKIESSTPVFVTL